MGSAGKRHYRLLQEAGEEVTGVDKPKNIPYLINPETLFIQSWNDFDMVWICTPNSAKENYVIEALKQGKKVFVEKPYGIRHEGQIFVACNYRFHPAVKVLKDNLNNVGKILYSRMHFSHYLPDQRENWKEYMKDTNITMDAGWHFVDLALWLFGKKNDKPSWNCFSDRELGISDLYVIWIEHETGILTQINLDYLRRDKSWGIEIIGTEGTLELKSNFRSNYTSVQFLNEKNMCYEYFVGQQVHPDEMYHNQLNYLLKDDWKSNLDEAKGVMKICS